ncbi:MAG: sensor histidine kinase [Actinomycetaceae bacterium]|nr:sensor histidine kinase [Actinomycetaceae bacterium]
MRRFARYALSRWYQLVVLAACIALIVFVLSGTGINKQATILVALTVCGAWLAMIVFGFLHTLPTWRAFDTIADSESPLDERVPRETSAPEQAAGARACETLNYDARERLDAVTTSALEHREYIESWVHEVKTPIAAAYLALENAPSAGAGANQIASQLDRVGFYVDQALFFARSSSVERDYFISRLSVRDVVSAAVRERRRSLIDAHMSIDMSGIDDGICVLSDEKWLVFMLGQLIDNAVKYRVQDGDGSVDGDADAKVQPVLSFSAAYEGEGAGRTVVLTVADNGCGISAADMPRIFDKGFTGENGRVRNEKATGLGLYLVAKLAQKMGLGIRASSTEGEGAAFSFVFPMPAD